MRYIIYIGMLGLLKNDQIVPRPHMTHAEKKRCEDNPGIDYIIERIGRTVYKRGEIVPEERPKGPGSRVFCLLSGTGTGKSALVAPRIYQEFKEETKRGIVLTQPIRATTMDIPFQIVKYNKDLIMGDNIGYQTGTMNKRPRSGILICTIGILTQFLKNQDDDEFMRKYAFILIDEVHQRSIDLDVTIFMLKKLLDRQWENPLCPTILLMSGTFDPQPFMKYFGCPTSHLIEVRPIPSYPIKDHFTHWSLTNYAAYIEDLVADIHQRNMAECLEASNAMHILVFMHSTMAITQMVERVHKLNATYFGRGAKHAAQFATEITERMKLHEKQGGSKKNRADDRAALLPIPLLSELIGAEGKEYEQLYAPVSELTVPIYAINADGKLDMSNIIAEVPVARKVLIGTNAIETGLTINGLKYCIDTGFVKDVSWQPNFMTEVMLDKPVPQSSMMQRRGRVGRIAPGEFYACYTQETVKSMDELQAPDIQRNNAAALMLSIICSETGARIDRCVAADRDARSFQMNQIDQYWYSVAIDQPFKFSMVNMFQLPPSDALIGALDQLLCMGFITSEYLPTAMGVYANKFRKVSLPLVRMIFAAYAIGANVLDIITMAAFMGNSEQLRIDRRTYKPIDVFDVGSEADENEIAENFTSCECIEYLLIYLKYCEVLDRIAKQLDKRASKLKQILPMNYIYEFAENIGVRFQGLMNIIEARDELINDMLHMGLDPYYNGLELPRGSYNLLSIIKKDAQLGRAEIVKIKQCILEGYRYSVCVYDQQRQTYICQNTQVPVKIKSTLVSKNAPSVIVATQMQITSQPGSAQLEYQFVGKDISVMDNFINVDVNFLRY